MRDDFASAKTWCDDYHAWCVEKDDEYHNARNFDGLNVDNKFPDTSIQEDIDHFVADARFKLFNGTRPCTIVGREKTDKEDAEAKKKEAEAPAMPPPMPGGMPGGDMGGGMPGGMPPQEEPVDNIEISEVD